MAAENGRKGRMNTLYFGDNLEVLRESIADRSVDLVYLDPPFNSGANYNIIFQPEKKSAAKATAQIQAFEDTWTWSAEADETYRRFVIDRDLTRDPPGERLIKLMTSMREYLGETPMMAYLTMMAPRLLELRRVLKDTGSIYLHCDPTASHYLKILMDGVFGPASYRNEIVWKRTSAHNDPRRYGGNIDTILFYTRGLAWTWNPLYTAHDAKYVARFRHRDPDGRRWTDDNLSAKGLSGGGYSYEYKGVLSLWRCPEETMKKLDADGRLHFTRTGGIRLKRYLDENMGTALQSLWDDISPINSQAAERMGYPTQKPQALLERIIKASSNEGDVVLDPFCGCGTAVAAAQKLNRQWVGIDITYLSIDLIAARLRKTGLVEGKDFVIKGAPADVMGAEQLAARAPFQFQYWALSRIPGAMPSERKTGDHGVDGVLHFWDPAKASKAGKGVISVKGTIAVNPGMVRDLAGTVDHQDADFGILITLQEPTEGMRTEARKAGVYKYNNQREIPRLQIVSAADLFKEYLPLQLPPEEVRNGRKMTVIAEPGADEAKGGLFGE
jgi:site-specific DNA-methyltransferase (adenine-specific)